MGTPAFPIAARVARKTQPMSSKGENVIPCPVQTNKMVIKMKAAHPFILIIEQRGKLNCAVLSESFRRFFAHSKARGSDAFDDFVKKAVVRAGIIPRAIRIGEIFFHFKRRGRTINP